MDELQNLVILLLILYIFLIIYIFKTHFYHKIFNKEHFITLEDSIANVINPNTKNNSDLLNNIYKNNKNNENNENKKNENNKNPQTEQKKEVKNIKFIYLLSQKINNTNNKYIFYDKNNKFYMLASYFNDNNIPKILFTDIKNNNIGNLIYVENNKFIFSLDFYKNKNLNIDFFNEYKEAKIYLDDDDKFFYIKTKNNSNNNFKNNLNNTEYEIFLFSKKIGIINKNNKIMVYEEYKEYLNTFGIALILFDNIFYIK